MLRALSYILQLPKMGFWALAYFEIETEIVHLFFVISLLKLRGFRCLPWIWNSFRHSDKQIEGDYGFGTHAGQPTASSTGSFKYFVFHQILFLTLNLWCGYWLGIPRFRVGSWSIPKQANMKRTLSCFVCWLERGLFMFSIKYFSTLTSSFPHIPTVSMKCDFFIN